MPQPRDHERTRRTSRLTVALDAEVATERRCAAGCFSAHFGAMGYTQRYWGQDAAAVA